MSTDIGDLPKPHVEGTTFDTKKYVVMVANDKTTKYLANRRALKRFSQLFRDMTDIDEDEPLPLDDQGAEKEIVAMFAHWINYYGENPNEKFTRLEFPLPDENDTKKMFADWDLRFIEKYLAKDGKMDLTSVKNLFFFGRLGVFLNAQVPLEISSGYMGHKIRQLDDEGRKEGGPSPEAGLRSWFGLKGEFTDEERSKILKDHEQFKDPGQVLNNLKENSEKAHAEAEKALWTGAQEAAAEAATAAES